jgi:hypothetical protein
LNGTKTTQTSDVQETPNNVADEHPTSGLAITSLVIGILNIAIAFVFIKFDADNFSSSVFLVFIIAIAATVLGVKANNKGGYSSGMAIVAATGILLGGIEMALSAIVLFGLVIGSCLA